MLYLHPNYLGCAPSFMLLFSAADAKMVGAQLFRTNKTESEVPNNRRTSHLAVSGVQTLEQYLRYSGFILMSS